MELKGKKALITGAGQGIGRAIALELAGRGAAIIAVSRTASYLESLLEELNVISKNIGSDATNSTLSCDLGEADGVNEFYQHVTGHGCPDIVVANLNIRSPLAKIASKEFEFNGERLMDNLTHLLRIMPETLEHQKERRFGRWIGISSLVVSGGGPGQALYAAKKGVVDLLLKNIAVEYGAHNITSNIVSPGLIATEGVQKRYPAERLAELAKMNSIGRCGEPHEVAHCVAFLAAPHASYITGATIPVNGGSELNWQLNLKNL